MVASVGRQQLLFIYMHRFGKTHKLLVLQWLVEMSIVLSETKRTSVVNLPTVVRCKNNSAIIPNQSQGQKIDDSRLIRAGNGPIRRIFHLLGIIPFGVGSIAQGCFADCFFVQSLNRPWMQSNKTIISPGASSCQ